MSRVIRRVKEKQADSNESVFYTASVIFAVVFCFASRFRDDVSGNLIEGTIADYWQRAVELYGTWASRVLVNFAIFVFTDHWLILWAAFMGFSLFVLLKALSVLFVRKPCRECNYFIVCMVMLYSFQDLYTAGWISTMTTYFSPAAFGFMSLVPIKKIYNGEIIKTWEYAAYLSCLIFGANNEQVMVVILGSYTAAVIYWISHRKYSLYGSFLFLAALCSCIFTLSCPGNANRKQAEAAMWFPTYGMLNVIDKADLGIFTTIKWILFGNHIFILVICMVMAALIWKKYQGYFVRLLALVPVVIMLFTKPLSYILSTKIPFLKSLVSDIPYYGLVTVENRGSRGFFAQYMVMGCTMVIICMEIWMLVYDVMDFAVAVTMLITGAASRFAMGFSPTIYASGYRTCAVMSFCMVAVMVLIYTRSVEKGLLSYGVRKKSIFGMRIVIGLCFIKLFLLVRSV